MANKIDSLHVGESFILYIPQVQHCATVNASRSEDQTGIQDDCSPDLGPTLDEYQPSLIRTLPVINFGVIPTVLAQGCPKASRLAAWAPTRRMAHRVY